MAIGTALAIAGISAAASVGGAALSSKAQKRASKSAAATAQSTADTNNALQRDIYAQNQSALAPFMTRGNAAGDQINALLGISPTRQSAAQPQPMTIQPNAFAGYQGGGIVATEHQRQDQANLEAQYGARTRPYEGGFGGQFASEYNQYASRLGSPHIINEPGAFYGEGQINGATYNQSQAPTGQATTPGMAQNAAFDNFRNSTGYQFRFNEGANALGAGFAARGLNNSGAAARAAITYGQNVASGEFGNYYNMLAGQQGIGLQGASALAGVGQNYAGQVSANNNSAGTAAANAALLRGQSQANFYGTAAGALGNVFGSSFGFGR